MKGETTKARCRHRASCRVGGERSELEAQTGADGVEVEGVVPDVDVVEDVVVALEAREAVLEPGRQVVGDSPFHAGAEGPAVDRVVAVVVENVEPVAEPAGDAAERPTAGGVDEHAVERETGA